MKRDLPISDDDFRKRSLMFLKELGVESDRGMVLVAAAVLEENLEMLLRSVMRNDKRTRGDVLPHLFRADGPLGSFAGKTRVCYAMELIDELTYRDLNTVRTIRNEFAHSYAEAKLANTSVRDRIAQLETAKLLEEKLGIKSEVNFVIDERGGLQFQLRKKSVDSSCRLCSWQ